MRSEPRPTLLRRLAPHALAAGMVVGLSMLAGCSSLPFLGGKPNANVKMRAAANCNDCGKGTGSPLRYRILQLRDGSVLTGVSVADLWDKEEKLLGAAFIARSQDVVIEPGARKSMSVELDPETRAVAVVGDFCKTQGSCWYYVRSRKGGGVGLDLVADASCLRPR